jgi:D-3-phosphoglycerate dehydrogenase
MRFIAHDPYQDPKIAAGLGVELVGLDELFWRSDFLSVSVPLSEATHHLVNDQHLRLMKPTAYLINTSRGPVVDQHALYRALVDGTIAGAGLDVFETEPCPTDEPILKLDNVVVAPHALCWTDECFAGNGAADVRAVLEVMHGRVPVGIVNKDVVNQAAWRGKLTALEARFGG